MLCKMSLLLCFVWSKRDGHEKPVDYSKHLESKSCPPARVGSDTAFAGGIVQRNISKGLDLPAKAMIQI